MFNVDPSVLAYILSGNPEMTTRTQVLAPGGVTTINVEQGSSGVQGTFGQQVGKTLALSVDRSVTDAGLLNPVTDHVLVTCVLPFTEIPMFYGRPTDWTRKTPGQVSVRCADDASDLINDDFIVPYATTPGNSVAAEVQAIVAGANAAFGVDTSRMNNGVILASQVWEDDRGQALGDLCTATNNLWQAGRAGGFIFYPNPYANPQVYVPTWTFKNDGSGQLISVEKTEAASNVYNAVTIIVERTDIDPIRITVYDNDPTSPTRWGGPFGYRNKNVKTQTPNSTTEAKALGLRLLRQYTALTDTWVLTLPFFPLVDQGDVIALWDDDNTVTPLVVESYSSPMDPQGSTTVSGRKLTLIDPSLAGVL
jgi:hypothetical protein